MSRKAKAPAKSPHVRNVEKLIGTPRLLTVAEKKKATAFYDTFGGNATAVEVGLGNTKFGAAD